MSPSMISDSVAFYKSACMISQCTAAIKAQVTVKFADPEANKRERTLEEAAYIHFVDFMDECAGMLNMT